MYALRVFGGASLEGPDGPLTGRIVQRRPLALLALLAASPQRHLSRDKLVGYLWPENDTEHARHLLSATLHVVRRALGEDAVLSTGDDLRLSAAVVWTDVGAFQDALDAGDPERAVAEYAGSFLDGFYLCEGGEFERWVEAERDRHARSYAEALEALAEAAEAEGEARTAKEWWKRLAGHDPYSSRIALRLIRALGAAGERADALRHARIHEALLRSEFGAAPDPEVEALAERLREGVTGAGPVPTAAAPLAPAGSAAAGASAGSDLGGMPSNAARYADGALAPVEAAGAPRGGAIDAAKEPASAVPRSGTAMRGRRRAPRLALASATAAFIALAVGWAAWPFATPEPAPATATESTRIAVFPFAYHGSDDLAYLGEGMVDLLSMNLDGAGRLRSVDPNALMAAAVRGGGGARGPEWGRTVAERFRAPLFVLGDITEIGGDLRMTAYLYDRRVGPEPLLRARTAGAVDEIFGLVDELSIALLANQPGRSDERVGRMASVTTHSLPALKAYLEGESEYRAGQLRRAAAAYRRAVAADSAFALAWLRLAIVAGWTKQAKVSEAAAARAERHAGRLPQPQRELLLALIDMLEGRANRAERFYREYVTMHPEDADAWQGLASVLVLYNPLRGRSAFEAQSALDRALMLDPGGGHILIPLAYILGRSRQYEKYATVVQRLGGDHDFNIQMRAVHAFSRGDMDGQRQITAELRRLPPAAVHQTVRYVTLMAPEVEGAIGLTRLLMEPARPAEVRSVAHVLAAHLELARGRRHTAEAELASAAALDPQAGLIYPALLAALPFVETSDDRLTALREALTEWDVDAGPVREYDPFALHDAIRPHLRAYLIGLLSVRLGDEAAALRAAAALERLDGAEPVRFLTHDLVLSVRAALARAQGRTKEALAALEAAHMAPPFRYLMFQSSFYSQYLERYRRGVLLAEEGRLEEALGWLEMVEEASVYGFLYVAPAHRQQAMIYERLGEPEKAAEHYASFIELWKNCDPELRPLLVDAQRRLARLRGSGADR